jgi:hypothetical protein
MFPSLPALPDSFRDLKNNNSMRIKNDEIGTNFIQTIPSFIAL